MGITEILESVTEFIDNFRLGANDHPEEVLREETLTRESHTVLLLQQFLAEVNIIYDILKLGRVNTNHHVHRS